MVVEANTPKPQENARKVIYRNAGDAIYGLGFIGALVYYIQHANTFAAGAFGLLKAVLWPAIMVYRLLDFLKL